MTKKKVSIIGGASISAAFLMKYLARHPKVEFGHLFSKSHAGHKVQSVHTFLTSLVDAEFQAPDNKLMIDDSDIIFICRGHCEFIDDTAKLYNAVKKSGRDIKIIDLSADFRLKDTSGYLKWYGIEHKHEELLKHAEYGLPELYSDEIAGADFVANPGCYPTCAILSLAPLVKKKIDYDGIIINALSGISGAGNRPSKKNIAVNIVENICAYKVGGVHQHTPEIEQELSRLDKPVIVDFVPHVAPFKFGIFQTIYVKMREKQNDNAIYKIYADFYKENRFVNVMAPPMLPQIKDVVGTNCVNIGFNVAHRTNTLIIISCIDNIVKGAAGQAIQNMNIMCGFDEAESLV